MSLNPICDFCDREIDDDEELKPIFVGDQPEPEYRSYLQMGYADPVEERRAAYSGVNQGPQMLQYPIDEAEAVLDSLGRADFIEVKTTRSSLKAKNPERVVVQGDGVHPTKKEKVDRDRMEWEEKVGAQIRLTIDPEYEMPDPDLEVCPMCAESIRGEGQ